MRINPPPAAFYWGVEKAGFGPSPVVWRGGLFSAELRHRRVGGTGLAVWSIF
jgi:hypothetical protein